jgi:hypothetical protein
MIRYIFSIAIIAFVSQWTFAATITSKNSGNWSSSTTWNGSVVPGVNDDVVIPNGANIVLDANASVKSIMVDGTLKVVMTKDISITTAYIMIHGNFEWGTAANPYLRKGLITLTGSDKSLTVMGMGTKMISTMGGGVLNIHGKVKKAWTMLNASVIVGGTSVTLQDAVDWEIGDEFIITTTGREHDLDKKLSYTQTEKRTITSISADKKTITFSTPLNYAHFGQLQTYNNGTKSWVLDERAEVGVLTRNIKIQGDASSEANQFGGHIMAMGYGSAKISAVELYRMGQAGVMGRYPFHWHLMGDVTGQYIKNASVHHSFQRAITVHGVQNATVESNVCYDIKGHGIFLEDGNESGTKILNNLVSYVHKPDLDKVIRPSDVFNLPSRIDGPAGIWISHPTNDLVNNAVSSCGSGIWYALLEHPDGPSYNPNVWVNNQPLGNVDGNRTHGCYSGFIVDFADVDNRSKTEAVHYHCPAGQVVKNATSFHCMRTLWWRGNYATFDNFKTANPHTHQGGNIFTFYGAFTNGLMVGHSANNTSSADVMMYGTGAYDGNHEFVNTHFENFDKHNQAITTMIGGASKNLPATMENCTMKNARVMHLSKTWEGNPEEQNIYASLLWDKTGQVLGAPNKWAVLNHPFLTDNTFTPIDNLSDIGGATTNNTFARVRFVIHDITEQTKSTLYADWSDGHQAHNRPLGPHWEVPVMVNSSRIYRFRMTDYTPKKMTVSYGEARVGDKIKFFVEGFPQEMNIVSHPEWPYDNTTALRRVYSQADYNNASDNVYWWDGTRAWFQLIARYGNNERSENILITSPTGNQLGVANVASRPYLGKRWNVNAIVQAEEFDHGGKGVAYFEKKGNDYLTMYEFKNFDHIDKRFGEIVDLTKVSPQSNNFYISDIKTNEWWNYSYTIPSAGTYMLKLSLSSTKTSNEFRVLVDGNEVGRKTFGAGDFNVQTMNLTLTQGNHVIRIEALTDDFLFDWLSIQNTTSTTPFLTITAPTENQKVVASVTFSATASNNASTNGNGISNLVFNLKQNGVVKATFTDNAVPYNWAINTVNYGNGLYELEVIAKNTSNQTTTKIIPVQIENPYDCAGMLNGKAFMDGCGKCAGGNTGLPVCADTLWEKGFELQRWAWGADVTFNITDETLEATSTGGNRHFWGPDNVSIPTDQFKYFHVRMKNPGTETQGRISWFRADGTNDGFSYTLSANKTDYVDYVIDLSAAPNYSGIIKRLLFQPTAGSNIGTTVSIDRIELSRIDRRDCNGVWRGTAKIDNCATCVGGNTGKTSAPGCADVINPIASNTFWDFTSTLEGWNGINQMTSSVASSVAAMTITGSDPYMHSPDNLALNASNYKYVVVSMQNQTIENTAELFWTTTSATGFDGLKMVQFPIIANDTRQRYYIIDLSLNPNWAGTIKQLRLDPIAGGSSGISKIDFIKVVGSYTLALQTIPGTIEAENFNLGGQGNAYKDDDVLNNGGLYRTSDAVDIEASSAGGYNVGWYNAGEWMEYLVNVTKTDNYKVQLKTSTPFTGKRVSVLIDGIKINTVTAINTGGWQVYAFAEFTISSLTVGKHIIRILAEDGAVNIDNVVFSPIVVTPPTLTPYVNINNSGWVTSSTASVCAGGSVWFGPHPNVETGWSWSGPNGFTSSSRSVYLSTITSAQAGNYRATYTDGNGVSNTVVYVVTVNSLPVATITPGGNVAINAGASIVLTSSLGASYQWFKDNIATAITTSSITVNTAGSYWVEVTNTAGCKATSLATLVSINPLANVLPTVSITAPLNNASYTAPANITITSNASDADGTISKVEFFRGTTLLGSDLTAPYSFSWTNVAAGTYTITAKATDNAGGVKTSTAITVVVNAPANVLPTVSITAPLNNTSYLAPTNITITANASDADGSISKVEFYSGATLIGSSTVSPYTFVWPNVSIGTYTITAKAYDNVLASKISSSITLNVSTTTSTVGIFGPSCVNVNSPITYTLNTGLSTASQINWWTNSGATIVVSPTNKNEVKITFPSYMNGMSTTLFSGANLTASPWYKEFTYPIKVGGCNSTSRVSNVTATPMPFETTTTITVSNTIQIHNIVIYDVKGIEVQRIQNVDSNTFELGENLATGIYIIHITTAEGVDVMKIIKGL